MANGEQELVTLLQQLQPELHPGTYVFVTVADERLVPHSAVIAIFREVEGITLVLPQGIADEYGLPYDYTAAWITLKVHSALSAVGLTATFATALANVGLSCNVIAGYYHDHIFVDHEKAQQALNVLISLSKK